MDGAAPSIGSAICPTQEAPALALSLAPDRASRSIRCPHARRTWRRRRPSAPAEPALPLFAPDAADDEPLVKLPAVPRVPLAVRKTPEVPRLRPTPAFDQPRLHEDAVLQFVEEPDEERRVVGAGSRARRVERPRPGSACLADASPPVAGRVPTPTRARSDGGWWPR